MGEGGEAGRRTAGRPGARGDPFLVEGGNASVQRAVVVLDETDGPVSRLPHVTRPTAGSCFGRRWRQPDRHAGPGPGEAAVGRAVDPDAAGVIGPVEVDLRVVGHTTPIEERDRVAAAVQVIAAR